MKVAKPQSRLKRFFKGLCKTVGFMLVYLVVAVGTAAGIIFLSPSGDADNSTFAIPVQLTKIMNNFQLVKALDVNLNVDVQTSIDDYNVVLDAKLDLDGGFENLNAEGFLEFNYDEQNVDVDFTYKNGLLYLDMLSGKFTIQTDNLINGVQEIATLLELEVPDLGEMGIENLDANTILSFLSDLEEEKGSDSITLNINIPIIGKLQIICDLNYSVKEIYLPKFDVSDGTSIELASNLNYPTKNIVATPAQQDYVDVTELADMASCAIRTLKQDRLGFDASLNLDNNNINGHFDVDLNTMSASFAADLFDTPIKVIVRNKTFFFELGNSYLKFNFNDAPALQEFLARQFDLNLPLVDVTDILASLQEGTFLTTLREKLNQNEDSDLNSNDLGKLESFEKIDSGYCLSIRDFGTIVIKTAGQKLSSLSLEGKDYVANLNITSPKTITVADKNHADVALALPAIDTLLNTLKSQAVSIKTNLQIDDTIFDVNIGVDKINNSAYLTSDIFGDKLEIYANNNTIFASYKGLKLYGYESDFDVLQSDSPSENFLLKLMSKLLSSGSQIQLGGLEQTQDGLLVNLGDQLVLKLLYNDIFERAEIIGDNYNGIVEFTPCESLNLPNLNTADYSPAKPILQRIAWIRDYINNGQYYLSFNANFGNLQFAGNVNFDNDKLSLYATTAIDGIKMEVRLIDGIIYFNTISPSQESFVNIKFNLSDSETVLTFLNEQFGLDFAKPYEQLMSLQSPMNNSAQSFDLIHMLNNLAFDYNSTNGNLKVHLDDYSISFAFNKEKLDDLTISGDDFSLSAAPATKQKIVAANRDYFDIVDALPFISKINSYLSAKEFSLSANASVYRGSNKIYSANDIKLQLSAKNELQFYTNANLIDGSGNNTKFEASLYGDKLYFTYDTLALSLGSDNFKELLSMGLRIFNINENALDDLLGLNTSISNNVDFSSLAKLLPNVGSGSSVSLLQYLKGFNVDPFNNNVLIINLDGTQLSRDERANDMRIRFTTNSATITNISIENLYTSQNEHFNFDLSLQKLNTIEKPDLNKKYLDISGAEELIGVLANTVSYSTFAISGTLNMDLKLGIIHVKLDIPINIQIVLNSLSIKNIVAEIGPIPVVDVGVYNVNNDTNWVLPNIGNRMMYVYYQDNYFYFYRHENRFLGDYYEKSMKASAETVLNDIYYYVQWGLGLNDSIMEMIREQSNEIVDIGNVVTSFSKSSNDFYNVTINMHELQSEKMGDLLLGIGVTQLNGKTVINRATMDLDMPLISGTTLYLRSSDLKLDLGKSVNLTPILTHMHGYQNKHGKEDVEYEAYNGAWEQAKARSFTVTFDANAGIFDDMNYPSITDTVGSPFVPPSLNYRSIGKKVSGTDYTIYQFDGWYTSSNYAPNTKVTNFVIPRKNVTLHAKWNVSYAYRTIKYYSEPVSGQSPRLLGQQYSRVGSALRTDYSTLGIAQYREQIYKGSINGVYGQYKLKQKLTWVDAFGCPLTQVPNESINVYASYQTYETIRLS